LTLTLTCGVQLDAQVHLALQRAAQLTWRASVCWLDACLPHQVASQSSFTSIGALAASGMQLCLLLVVMQWHVGSTPVPCGPGNLAYQQRSHDSCCMIATGGTL
jgi:hypothetical protein